ncbi:uncharacterized protein LOC144475527 isoform X2 [Augochlora pura]
MASDLSSGCTEATEVLDEKEEGEISLEDVSSSEEGHLNYGYGTRVAQCSNCSSTQHNAAWCTAPAKLYHSRGPNRREVDLILQDAVQGKENRHQVKESGCVGAKHTVSTLQEKNDDLVPISSDSDMEIVGLADNSKQIVIHTSSKSRVKKRKKKKRSHPTMLKLEDLISSSTVDTTLPDCVGTLMHDMKMNSSRSYHREISPTHRTNRPRVTSRSPPRRHRPVIQSHSTFRRSKSPVIHARSTVMKRSPRRLKSPKRSPSYRPPTEKMIARKPSYLETMPSSHNYIDTHKLLKKVRQLDSIGTESRDETLYKNKQHASSLKEKLSHMMKGACDNNSDVSGTSKDKSNARICEIELNDADDEEDLALLRQKALETQQKKSNKQNEQLLTETVKKISIDDDQDEEDLELRMIALRSAVLKKHQNRLQKGMKSGKYKKCNASRSESPFTQSFLDSIPIPGEDLLSIASPPHTPMPMIENNHTEDMDLDTDVEREKEKLPYSPTDKITANINIDTELLGIQPSDVSFINLNDATNSTNFNTVMSPSQDEQKSYQGKIIENRSYLPNVVYYTPPQNPFYVSPNSNIQYSPVHLAESIRPDYIKVHDPRMSILNNTSNYENSLSQERPYSPTDAPIYDPDLSQTFPQALEPVATLNSSLTLLGSPYNLKSRENNEQCNCRHSQVVEDNLNTIEPLSTQPNVISATTSQQGSVSPSSSMVTIDDLPETDVDMTCSDKTVKSTEYVTDGAMDSVKEPLYMKGIPDVTKDVNKIPTLINRTLVPASILKTNKQLQQPLQTKKPASSQEPTFKSAEMQPVNLPEDTRMNSSFKPIKFMSIPQKTHNVLVIPTVFHDSMQEDPTNEQPSANEDSSLPVSNNNNNATSVQTNVNTECPDKACDIRRHKKSKRGKRKSSGTKAGTNNDNIDILDKQLSEEASELMRHDDIENHTVVSKLEIPKDSVLRNQISSKTNESELKGKEVLPCDTIAQVQDAKRRQSLDEDEEALRAILLASLPKRTKMSSQTHSNSMLNVSASPDCTSQIAAVQVAPTIPVTATSTNSITSSSSMKSYGSENDRNQSNSTDKPIIAATAQENLLVGAVKPAPLLNSGKKRLVPMTKGPQKKHMKRIPIPASTKVVNNAKKYQNAMIQKKLNVQKAALYSKQKITDIKVAAKVQANDTKWSTTTKTVSDTQRIVINLESDTESDSEAEQRAEKIKTTDKQPTVNPTAEFEKNLEQFLRDVRNKQESMAAARPTPLSQISKKDTTLKMKLENSSNLHTPLAVRHLPASQQEEYRRLKQQILEREKLKLHRTVETNALKSKTVETISKPISSDNPAKESNSKINQMAFVKSTETNTQQLNKENYSKNLDSVKNTSNNKTLGADKQEITSPSQTKAMVNLNISISNENSLNNVNNKIVSPSQAVTTSHKVIETQNEISPKSTQLQGLKVLSTVEVNRKFVQIQLKNDAKERVLTINNEVTLNDNKTVIKRNENVSGSKEAVDDQYTNQLVQSVEKAVVANYNTVEKNDSIDSDASTVILNSQNAEREISMDTSAATTVRLSQLEESSRLSISPTKCKDDDLPLFKSNLLSSDKKSIVENWETIKRDVKTKLDTLITLPRAEQEQHLMNTEEKLVLKRYTILDDLAEMSGSLRQWHMERDLQTNLVAEVKKLREQLKVAEERLQLQRNRINSIGPKVVATHGKINAGRQECFKLATICTSLGSRIIGKEYKVPEAGAQLLDNRLKEVANHTRQLSRKKVPSIILAEAYELKSDDTLSIVNSDVSQTDDSLVVQYGVDILNNIDNPASTILNSSECSMKESEPEENVLEENTVIDVKETDDQEERNVAVNDSSISDNVESVPQQSYTEEKKREETIVHQSESSNVLVAVSNITSPNDSKESNQECSSGDPTVTPESTSESCSHDKISAKSEADCSARKIIVPYESVLVHFKVPRNTNPNGVLCPYELMGTCNDGECQFVHQRENQAK